MFGTVIVAAFILIFQNVDDRKIRLHCPPVFILQNLNTLVLEPVNNSSVFIFGDTRHVGFAGLDLHYYVCGVFNT